MGYFFIFLSCVLLEPPIKRGVGVGVPWPCTRWVAPPHALDVGTTYLLGRSGRENKSPDLLRQVMRRANAETPDKVDAVSGKPCQGITP